MAPPNGPVKGRKAGASKQPPKAVVPALPLPYVKRKAAAAAKDQPDPAAKTQAQPTASQTSLNRSPVDDIMQHMSGKNHTASLVADSQQESELLPASEDSANEPVDTKEHASTANDVAKLQPQHALSVKTHVDDLVKKPDGNTSSEHPAAADPSMVPSMPELQPHISTAVFSTAAAKNESQPKPIQHHDAIKIAATRPPPGISPSRYQMPPPFQPANRPYGRMNNGDVARGSRPPVPNGPTHMHHPHPSNGSIHFGTFQDSQNTSPAPPHSGGIVPPPGLPTAEGRPGYMLPAGNGFPPMLPYGTDIVQPTGFDNFGRPAMGFGPMDAFPPYGNNFGPSTPHSFHDSQSSGQAEENGIYHQYPLNGHRNGVAGHGDVDGHSHNHQGRMFGPQEYPRMAQGHGPPPHLYSLDDNGDQLVDYMRQNFGDTELADCTLELRYLDDRAAPVRIPGHRLMFARSGTLAALLKQQTPQGASDRSFHTLLIETESKWLRSESFYMAVQRLYGLPLLQMPPRGRPDSPNLTDAGSLNDQLDFALSFAAAGHLLKWAPVLRRGCEVATQLLHWHTLEKIIEFALEGYTDNGSSDSFKYGEGSGILLNALVTFIVHNTPPTFNLDTSSVSPKQYARLPEEYPPPMTAAKKPAPVIARGSSVQLGKGRRSQQITGIQFGDLSLGEELNGCDSETPKAPQQAQPVPHAVLSRALINLPFSRLKMILESAGSGNVNGWANAESRYRIIRSAVDERETRRRHALDAVLRGRVPESDHIRAALRSPIPQDMGPWSVLGWQEEILPNGNADLPALGRKWVPYLETRHEPAAEYP
ncbi:hypothetical protein QQS21_011155 [Conoideocrella luteorostrata]|uniref:Uncharacterized protein n=1 Tax=Conoideocrella luteorostrata TaxID=1105319 RepID=A0AAJ0FNN6_9HYPO|nr:hypothetical protein QQS21_011155 [Conoideocrella luteorostrata]